MPRSLINLQTAPPASTRNNSQTTDHLNTHGTTRRSVLSEEIINSGNVSSSFSSSISATESQSVREPHLFSRALRWVGRTFDFDLRSSSNLILQSRPSEQRTAPPPYTRELPLPPYTRILPPRYTDLVLDVGQPRARRGEIWVQNPLPLHHHQTLEKMFDAYQTGLLDSTLKYVLAEKYTPIKQGSSNEAYSSFNQLGRTHAEQDISLGLITPESPIYKAINNLHDDINRCIHEDYLSVSAVAETNSPASHPFSVQILPPSDSIGIANFIQSTVEFARLPEDQRTLLTTEVENHLKNLSQALWKISRQQHFTGNPLLRKETIASDVDYLTHVLNSLIKGKIPDTKIKNTLNALDDNGSRRVIAVRW